jgi:hypothetical protein
MYEQLIPSRRQSRPLSPTESKLLERIIRFPERRRRAEAQKGQAPRKDVRGGTGAEMR